MHRRGSAAGISPTRRSTAQATAFRQIAAEFAAAGAADDEALFTRADRGFNDLLLDAANNEFAAEAASLIRSDSFLIS